MRAALAVARKELLTGFRDRQFLIYTIALPLALYPVVFWVMIQAMLVMEGREERTSVSVLVAGAELSDVRVALAAPPKDLPPGKVELFSEPPGLTAEEATARLRAEAPEAVDAVLVLSSAEGATLYYDASRSRSELARKRVEERLAWLVDDLRTDAIGGDARDLSSFATRRVDLASDEDTSAYVLSFVLPIMFVLMAVMGSFFPAIDLTAGEKERGTAETTLLLPQPRASILLGKVVAVAAFGAIATVLNALGLIVAAEHLLAGLGETDLAFDVPWSAFPAAAPLLLLFLLTTAAILVAVASLTKTFKQGQSMLGGVQMMFLAPAILVALPGVELTPGLALVPIAQTVLAFKAILQGEGATILGELVLVAGSQVVYAGLALAASLRLASREALLLGGESAGRLFQLLRAGGAPK